MIDSSPAHENALPGSMLSASSTAGRGSSSDMLVMTGASPSSCDASRVVMSAIPAPVYPALVSADATPCGGSLAPVCPALVAAREKGPVDKLTRRRASAAACARSASNCRFCTRSSKQARAQRKMALRPFLNVSHWLPCKTLHWVPHRAALCDRVWRTFVCLCGLRRPAIGK